MAAVDFGDYRVIYIQTLLTGSTELSLAATSPQVAVQC